MKNHSEEGDATPILKPETHTPCPDQVGGQTKLRAKPFTGGYYWFPAPTSGAITWSVVTCRDLGCRSDDGHDADLWPRLIVRLAATWGKDAQNLKRRLALSYTGLPRGRVTRPDKTFLVLHGKDAPIRGWEKHVTESFHLSEGKIKILFDEHETQIQGHSETFNKILNVRGSNRPT